MSALYQIYVASLLTALVTNSAVVYFLTRKKPFSLTVILFALFLTQINIWGLPTLLQQLEGITPFTFAMLSKVSAFGYTFLPVFFLLFALAFTKKLNVFKNYLSLTSLFLPPVIFLFLIWNTDLIEVHSYYARVVSDWGVGTPVGEFFPVFLLWFEILMLSGMLIIIHFVRATVDVTKKQHAVWILVAVAIPLSLGSITDGLMPMFGRYPFPVAVPLSTVLAIVISYAITRLELFELTLQDVLTNLTDGVLSVNNKQQVVFCNTVSLKLLGLSEKQVLSKELKDILKLVPDCHHQGPVASNPLDEIASENQLSSSDYFLQRADGSCFPVALSIQPIIFRQRVMGATLIFRDITKEKAVERSKDDFINMASHELKTPLTSIKLYNDLIKKELAEGNRSSAIASLIEKMQRQVARLEQLATDLLDFSQLQSKKLQLSVAQVDVQSLIEQVVADMNASQKSHRITIKGTIKRQVKLDRQRIEQVLVNFISNASKYSPQANSIVVHLKEKAKAVEVAVQDFGPGIAKADQRRIFERGFRVIEDHHATVPGFGMGLYISAKIIQAHGGTIGVRSTKGKGATFYFTLPKK